MDFIWWLAVVLVWVAFVFWLVWVVGYFCGLLVVLGFVGLGGFGWCVDYLVGVDRLCLGNHFLRFIGYYVVFGGFVLGICGLLFCWFVGLYVFIFFVDCVYYALFGLGVVGWFCVCVFVDWFIVCLGLWVMLVFIEC